MRAVGSESLHQYTRLSCNPSTEGWYMHSVANALLIRTASRSCSAAEMILDANNIYYNTYPEKPSQSNNSQAAWLAPHLHHLRLQHNVSDS